MADVPGVEALAMDGTHITCRTVTASRTLGQLLQRLDTCGIGVTELRVRKAALEDVFLRLTDTSRAE